MRKSFALAVLLLGTPSADAWAQERFTTAADAGGIVRITAADGDVRIRAHTAAQVRVIDLDGGDDQGIRVGRDGAEVDVDIFDDRDVEVLVPPGSRLDIRTRNGDVDVDGVRGSIAVETLSGDMGIYGTPASVTIESISGDVRVDGPVPTLRLNTVSGDIELPRATGNVDVTSTSGDIDVGGSGLHSGDFSATSGTIRFRADISADAVLEFSSASGTIDLQVPRDVRADFDIENVTGRIRSDIGPEPRRNRYTGGESLRFTHGGGGARIVIQNVSGEVYVVVR